MKIVTFYHVLTPAPHGPTLKQNSGHTKRVITSNCTKFLKYTLRYCCLKLCKKRFFNNALLFLIAEVSTNFPAIPRSCNVDNLGTNCDIFVIFSQIIDHGYMFFFFFFFFFFFCVWGGGGRETMYIPVHPNFTL